MASVAQYADSVMPNCWVKLKDGTANNDGTGAAGTVKQIFQVDTKGGMLLALSVTHSGPSIETTLRIYLNNGDDHQNSDNNILLKEFTIPEWDGTEAAPQHIIDFSDWFSRLEGVVVGYDEGNTRGNVIYLSLSETVENEILIAGFGGNY